MNFIDEVRGHYPQLFCGLTALLVTEGFDLFEAADLVAILSFSLDFFTKMPVKRRPPVVRPFVRKYMGQQVYQKRPWRTGFILWWHPRAKKHVWNWLYLWLCLAKLYNFSLESPKNSLSFSRDIFGWIHFPTDSWRTCLTGDW